MTVTTGFKKAMQEIVDYVQHQDLNLKREFQKELESVSEYLNTVLHSFEQESFNELSKNQDRKEFIEEAKRFWKENGKGYFLAQEIVNDDIVWRLGFASGDTDKDFVTVGYRENIPEIPQEYKVNRHLLKAFLLADMLGMNKYCNVTPPLPTHFVKGMVVLSEFEKLYPSEIISECLDGKPFESRFILLDDTDVVYE